MFIHDDFLLENDHARELYHGHAAGLPIIDYHCHLIPGEIDGDRHWNNLTEIWLYGDHYKWRAMRSKPTEFFNLSNDILSRHHFPMPRAFQIHPTDNVATLLDDAAVGDTVQVTGGQPGGVQAITGVAAGHKIALVALAEGDPVLKYGVRIGHCTRAIDKGEWVHLQNLASDLDERSAGLDLHTGAPSDTSTAYV